MSILTSEVKSMGPTKVSRGLHTRSNQFRTVSAWFRLLADPEALRLSVHSIKASEQHCYCLKLHQ